MNNYYLQKQTNTYKCTRIFLQLINELSTSLLMYKANNYMALAVCSS